MQLISTTTPTATPTRDIARKLLSLNITPAKENRTANSKLRKSPDEREVRAGETHSTEWSIIIWKLESFIRTIIQDKTDDPNTILRRSDGSRIDIIKVLHSLKRNFTTLQVGNPPRYLKDDQKFDSVCIISIIDNLRVLINESKHKRRKGFIFGIDLYSVGQTAKMIRSVLFLTNGPNSIMSPKVTYAIPRLPSLELFFVSRMLYTRANAAATVNKNLVQKLDDVTSKTEYVPYTKDGPITYSDLRSPRWVDLQFFAHICRDLIRTAFLAWVDKYKTEEGFGNIEYARNEGKDTFTLLKLVMRDIYGWEDMKSLKRNAVLYLEVSEPSEGRVIFETIKTELMILESLSITTDPSLHASSHDIFALILSTYEIVFSLKRIRKMEKELDELLDWFDAFIYYFTAHITVKDDEAKTLADLGVLEDVIHTSPGILFLDIDLSVNRNPNDEYRKMVRIGNWSRDEETIVVLRRLGESLYEGGAGFLAIEVPSEPSTWDHLKILIK